MNQCHVHCDYKQSLCTEHPLFVPNCLNTRAALVCLFQLCFGSEKDALAITAAILHKSLESSVKIVPSKILKLSLSH